MNETNKPKTASTLIRVAQCATIIAAFIIGMIMNHLDYVIVGFLVAWFLAAFID